MWVISVRGICALIGVFNNTGQTGESTIGIFVKTRINKRGREGFGTNKCGREVGNFGKIKRKGLFVNEIKGYLLPLNNPIFQYSNL